MITRKVYDRYIDALVAGDKTECRNIVEKLLNQSISARELYVGLFQASMYHIGDLWQQGIISVGTEHHTSTITDWLITLAVQRLPRSPRTGRSIVITCCADEFHQLGAKIIADFFELSGWDVYYLGANMPIRDLLTFIKQHKPSVVGISLTMAENLTCLTDMANAINSTFPKTTVIISGQGLVRLGEQVKVIIKSARYLPALNDVEAFINE